MNYEDALNKELNKKVYILTGDVFLIKKLIKAILDKRKINSINISEFNDENFDARTVINACNQFSFFNDERMVVVFGTGKDVTQAEKNLFLNYNVNPNNNCLLFCVNNNHEFDFLKDVEVIECKPTEKFLEKTIKQEFEKFGKTVSLTEINKLIMYTKSNLCRIFLEIKKICDYLKGEETVTSKVIDELVAKDTELKVFDLTMYISQKNVELAHQVLYNMLKAGEPPIKILGLISSHFRRVFFAKISKSSNEELAKQLGCRQYAILKAKEESANFTAKQLKDIQNLILEADYNIKSGGMTQENTLYYLVMKISLI